MKTHLAGQEGLPTSETSGNNGAGPRASSVVFRYAAKNFTEATTLSVTANDHSEDEDIRRRLVTLATHEGACSFHFAMSPPQARSLAYALTQAAAELDGGRMNTATSPVAPEVELSRKQRKAIILMRVEALMKNIPAAWQKWDAEQANNFRNDCRELRALARSGSLSNVLQVGERVANAYGQIMATIDPCFGVAP